jgi:hypothetical protein
MKLLKKTIRGIVISFFSNILLIAIVKKFVKIVQIKIPDAFNKENSLS